jgi:hypothetical protein
MNQQGQKGQIQVLRDIINQLITNHLTMLQLLSPTFELEYGKETASLVIDEMGAQLRTMMDQIESMEPSTTVKVVPAKVTIKTRRRG